MKALKMLALFVFFSCWASCEERRTVSVVAREIDGTAIEGMGVTVVFLGYTGGSTERVRGKTDDEGRFRAYGNPELRMRVLLSGEGYYSVDSGRLVGEKDHDLAYVVKRVRNPIPLYAKRLQIVAPVIGEKFAYDCEVGDWVEPHGRGKVRDLVFEARVIAESDKHADYHYEVGVSFSNEGDGFMIFERDQYSSLQSPHVVPEDAQFARSWTYFRKKSPSAPVETNSNSSRGYIFRLRSSLDEEGNVLECNYAKAYGDLPDMKIYFNPGINDRNIEFDPRRNLFKDLASTDQVRDP